MEGCRGEGWRDGGGGGEMEGGEGWREAREAREARDGGRGGMEREGVRREEGAFCCSWWWALSSSFSNVVHSRHSMLVVGGIRHLRAVVAVFA